MNYWEECVGEALCEAGIAASKEQIVSIAAYVQGAHENYGMSHGHDAIPNPLVNENARLLKELNTERAKVTCNECWGVGTLHFQGPVHGSTTQCHVCRGEGKVKQ